MQFLPNARKIDDVLARTRVLLMPSLWYEGFGLIVMESMLRGIPVVASDSGGLQEAKCGTGYVIQVCTIECYLPVFDEHAMPKPVVPDNDATPWVTAIEELLTDADTYRRESEASRTVAERFVSGLDAGDLERFAFFCWGCGPLEIARRTTRSGPLSRHSRRRSAPCC